MNRRATISGAINGFYLTAVYLCSSFARTTPENPDLDSNLCESNVKWRVASECTTMRIKNCMSKSQ